MIDVKAIQKRAELLFLFNKMYFECIKLINPSERKIEDTLSNMHYKLRLLALPSVINRMVDRELKNIPEGGKPEINVNRRKAMQFADEGKVDHEGKYSIFGQIMQSMKQQGYGDLNCFRKNHVDGRIYRINFRGEGSIDAGGPFRDSIVNVVQEMEQGLVPLLIPSPNNRNEHGESRDCFILNSASKSPVHLEMFRFLGAFIAFGILSMSPVPLNLAPTVWKQILGEEQLTIEDLQMIDTYSS